MKKKQSPDPKPVLIPESYFDVAGFFAMLGMSSSPDTDPKPVLITLKPTDESRRRAPRRPKLRPCFDTTDEFFAALASTPSKSLDPSSHEPGTDEEVR